jgi:hypothetical protein
MQKSSCRRELSQRDFANSLQAILVPWLLRGSHSLQNCFGSEQRRPETRAMSTGQAAFGGS